MSYPESDLNGQVGMNDPPAPCGSPITEFKGQYRFLSNFYTCVNGIAMEEGGELRLYKSVEHAFQAAKTLDDSERQNIRFMPTPSMAKRAGRKTTLRADWERIKLRVMLDLVRQKFAGDCTLKQSLLQTGDAQLIEGNNHGQTYWGVCGGVGENHLGKILMAVRAELRGQCLGGWHQ